MYVTTKKIDKFDTDDKKAMGKYEKLINNPLCLILDNMREKIVSSEYNNGKLVRTETKIVFVVTYEERELV